MCAHRQAFNTKKKKSPALAPEGGEGSRGDAEGGREVSDGLARSLVEEAGPVMVKSRKFIHGNGFHRREKRD